MIGKCIVCGKDAVLPVKFDHGEVLICNSSDCLAKVNYRLNGENAPLLWVSKEDFSDRELSKYVEDMDEDAFIDMSTWLQEWVLDDHFWDNWGTTLHEFHVEIETDVIRNTERTRLPLLIGSLEYGRNQQYLEKRLSGEDK